MRFPSAVLLTLIVERGSCVRFDSAMLSNYTAAGAAQIYPNLTTDTGVSVFSEEGASGFAVTITAASSMWKQ